MGTVARRLQLTLALLKPDVTANPVVEEEIKNIIRTEKFLIVKQKSFRWTRSQAEQFYLQHSGKFFFQRLVNFMSSGSVTALILSRDNAIPHWRKVMGPTKVYRAIHEDPESVRGAFGLTDTRNSTHGSDSDQSAAEEISVIFPEFCIKEWHETVEPMFREGPVLYNRKKGLHQTTTSSLKI